ncbi:DUF5996 family protein [Pseudoclavibacter sp. RFBI4]|nr:DUF5996 family protein [Pseudoclavibacter sp. RFBI4]
MRSSPACLRLRGGDCSALCRRRCSPTRRRSVARIWPRRGRVLLVCVPSPAGFAEAQVPDGAYWDDALGEFLLPYEAVRASAEPDALVHGFLTATYHAATTLADWESVNQKT